MHSYVPESSWDPPAEGYMSIHQQKKMKFEEEEREKKEKAKAEKAEKRRQEIIEQQRSVHMRNEESYVIQVSFIQKSKHYAPETFKM